MISKIDRRSSTVPVARYRSPNIPMSAIRRYARQIVEQFKPYRIILFGSYAYGVPHIDSDVDLLVVMPATNQLHQAVRIRRTIPAPFPLDLIVRTPKNLERRLADGNWFLRELLEKGKVLHEKRNRPMGAESRGRLSRRAPPGRRKARPA